MDVAVAITLPFMVSGIGVHSTTMIHIWWHTLSITGETTRGDSSMIQPYIHLTSTTTSQKTPFEIQYPTQASTSASPIARIFAIV